MSPSTATAVVASSSRQDGGRNLVLRAVALTSEAEARGGVAAWDVKLEVDCRASRVRLGATTGYASPRAEGDGMQLVPAESAWRRPKPGTVVDAAWRSVCDSSFRPPLSDKPLHVAEVARTRTAAPQPTAPASPAPPPRAAAAKPGAAPASPPRPPAAISRAVVQVVSSPLEADTRRALASLKNGGRLEGLQTRIDEARVGGRVVYRGMVAGFASKAEAQAFCERLKRSGRDCVAR